VRAFLLQRAVSSLAGALALSLLIFGLISDAVTMWIGRQDGPRPEVQQTLRRMFGTDNAGEQVAVR